MSGFNTSLACCDTRWARAQTVPVVRGAFLTNNRLQQVKDLVSSAGATETTLSYTIRKNAYWNWGGRKIPVTYQDFVYTWQQMIAPANAVASREGYDRITGYTHHGDRQITFTWSAPYGAWRHLFDVVYPSEALAGLDFNRMWSTCICGSDGKPVADGPFLLTSYVHGRGSTLQANPFWYGHRPSLRELDFRVVGDSYEEVQALRRGDVELIAPTFNADLLPLRTMRGVHYTQVPGLTQEHLDLQLGSHGQPLLRAPWMRHAIMLAIDRNSLIDTVFGDLSQGMQPLDSLLFFPRDASYRPVFRKWSFNPKRALAILKRHCTGGPARLGAAGTWSCSGYPASFRYTWSSANASRTLEEALVKGDLARVGIAIVDAPLASSVVLGPSGIPSGDYDLADFSWTTSGDPGAFAPAWSCGGISNFSGYCNDTVTKLLQTADATPSPTRRLALYHEADTLLADDVPSIPLYAVPDPLIWRTGLSGLQANPSPSGFTWNVERWRWHT